MDLARQNSTCIPEGWKATAMVAKATNKAMKLLIFSYLRILVIGG